MNPEFSLRSEMTQFKLSYFGHILQRLCSLKKSVMLENIKGRLDYNGGRCNIGRPEGSGGEQLNQEKIYLYDC